MYFQGEWHLFYQYFEPRQVDGMQWGHAVSRDLVHWQHLPPAISPDRHGQIWSGSAVVDHHDQSGLFAGRPGLVCIYTYWDPADGRQCQGLAFSRDGRTFEKYPANPIIPQLRHLPGQPDDKDFRDPKVFWHAPRRRWVMVVAGGKVRIFTSPDLRNWQFESVADDLRTECPDLFALPVDGNPAETHWVLSGGGRWYLLGDFDGFRFTPRGEPVPMNHGPDFYATQTWSDAPDDRRVAISWMFRWNYDSGPTKGAIRNAFPTQPWVGGCLTVPYELTLTQTPAGLRLVQQPVRELAALRTPLVNLADVPVRPGGDNPLAVLRGQALDIELEIESRGATQVAIRFPAGGRDHYTVGYSFAEQVVFVDRRAAGFAPVASFPQRYAAPLAASPDGVVALRLLLDHCSLEVLDRAGLVTLSAFVLPDPAADGLELLAENGECRIRRFQAWAMTAAPDRPA